MTKVKLLDNRILVLPDEEEKISKGGILIPENMQESSARGIVIEIGDGLRTPEGKTLPMRVSKDDIVHYGKYVGTEITLDDIEYLIMREGDILMTEEN